MKMIANALVAIILLITTYSCDTTEPPYDNGNVQDTTSHNFTFETFTFGEHSSSTLYDVAIINDSSIWAVGEIYLNDSLGQPDPTPYNAIYWNGTIWEVIRIPTKTFSGTTVSSEIRTIFSFNSNDIWTFSIAGSYSHWNGVKWETKFVNEREGSGNKLWGMNSSNLYLVCNNGGISFFNGSSWQKIESGTDLNIYDILGQKTSTGDYEILCVAAKQSVSADKKIFSIRNNTLIDLSNIGIPYSIRGVWFVPGKMYYVVGSGIFSKTNLNSNQIWEPVAKGSQYYINSIDGNNLNDIVACGAYGELLHFNGESWQSFQNELKLKAGSFREVKIKDNLVIGVGYNSPKALIMIGRRI